MMPHTFNHFFLGFCQNRFGAEGDWDLIYFLQLRVFFPAALISSSVLPRLRQDKIILSDM